MIFCEALIFTLLICMLIKCSITDYKTGLIKNKDIIIFGILLLICDVVYYSIWQRSYLMIGLKNYCLLFLISIVLYLYHIWGAGDSKLLIVAGLGIPGRFFTFWDIGAFSGFMIIILTFTFAFLFVIIESLVFSFKSKPSFKDLFSSFRVKEYIVSYFFMVGVIITIETLLFRFCLKGSLNDRIVTLAISFILTLTLIQIRRKLKLKIMVIIAILAWLFNFVFNYANGISLSINLNLKICILVLLLMIIRAIAEKYNYQRINTSEVKPGQIMAMVTILEFQISKIKGLPTSTTEDLRSRITEDEANSIKRWETSKHGKPYITIVRKMPFALFISLGIVAFLIIEAIMLWK